MLYDGTGPDARLIGIEYLVTDAVYQKMPSEEKACWHDHKYEVDAGLLRSLSETRSRRLRAAMAARARTGETAWSLRAAPCSSRFHDRRA